MPAPNSILAALTGCDPAHAIISPSESGASAARDSSERRRPLSSGPNTRSWTSMSWATPSAPVTSRTVTPSGMVAAAAIFPVSAIMTTSSSSGAKPAASSRAARSAGWS